MSAPVVLVHLGDPHQDGRRLCDGGWLRVVPDTHAAALERKVCPRCDARKRELAVLEQVDAALTPGPHPAPSWPPANDRHPLVAQMLAGLEPQMVAMTQATVDAAVLGTGWIRITLCPAHGPELERVDPARIIVADPS